MFLSRACKKKDEDDNLIMAGKDERVAMQVIIPARHQGEIKEAEGRNSECDTERKGNGRK